MGLSDAFAAFSRFGLGARPGDLDRLAGDPRAALAAEIADPATLLIDTDLPDTMAALAQIRTFQLARQIAKKGDSAGPAANLALLVSDMQAGTIPVPPGNAPPGATPVAAIAPKGQVSVPGVMSPHDLMLAEIAARIDRVRTAEIGFGERLVAFWTNHFAVQAAAGEVVVGLAGAFEREAIRPHALGKFGDMLLAATRHPAMLVSLNNATSIGPDSPVGKRTGKGLNENHARELMELHSIGVDAGYSQADVTTFAKVLTGWTFGTDPRQPKNFGRFVFRAVAHEPGPQTIMGKLYPQAGAAQGLAAIADFAHSPATASHIALKLARHFVADTPDRALVKLLADTFTRTGGDLKAVTLALLDAPSAWSAPATKVRTPQEFVWAGIRALDIDPKPNLVVRALADLGQPLWNPPSPQGYKDDAATWLAPDAMTVRVDLAEQLAARAPRLTDPRTLATDLLGPALSAETRSAIDRAESRNQALAILLMSREFQRC
jgi:uncharacterized protein (DUF1800 family)